MSLVQNFFNIFRKPTYTYYFSPDERPSIEGIGARELYVSQANLHAVVSFLSDSIAQLPLKVYIREGENERKRDRESTAAKLLYRPNKDQTAYEFFNALSIEYLLFGEAIVLILPDDNDIGYQLRLIPNEWVEKREYENAFSPSKLKIRAKDTTSTIEVNSDSFVIFKMYNPGVPGGYLSPISSLRQTLSEQIQANRFRTSIWKSSGRLNSYITRPANVTPWTAAARDAWTESFRKGWSEGSQKAGSMPILEDGMEIKPYQFNAKEAQYAETVQLSREDVSAAYHINPSLIWHSTTQTYASAKDNARALYADCLGPLLQMMQQRINSFLLPRIGVDNNIYVEFDLEEKLKGSFEERAAIYQSAAGVPYLTVNEVRAELNRPPVEGGDERVIPMNVLIGGQMSPQDSTPESYTNMYSDFKPESKNWKYEKLKKEDVKEIIDLFDKFFKRQEKTIQTKIKTDNWWNEERWNKELSDDLYILLEKFNNKFNINIEKDRLKKFTKRYAEKLNGETYKKLLAMEETKQTVSEIFKNRIIDEGIISVDLLYEIYTKK